MRLKLDHFCVTTCFISMSKYKKLMLQTLKYMGNNDQLHEAVYLCCTKGAFSFKPDFAVEF